MGALIFQKGDGAMKKIIEGIKYDTDTAKVIDAFCNGLPMTSSRYIDEKLYQKGNGEFFLHGNGGARTVYCNSYPDGSVSGGEDIIPLSVDEAKEWVETHCTVEIYETLFGEVAE